MSIAELVDVSLVSQGRERLIDVSIAIEPGSITALIGPNGSGKSSLLGVLAGELEPTSGSSYLNGDDASSLSVRERARRRALLTQETTVAFAFPVYDVVSWGRTPWQGTSQATRDDEIIEAVLADQGLVGLRDRPVTELSGGERKRVHIARVLAQECPLVLLDEADSDLDVTGRAHLDDVVRRLADQGTAVVVVSHDLTRISATATRVVAMARGQIRADGSPGQVMTDAVMSDVFATPCRVVSSEAGFHVQVN